VNFSYTLAPPIITHYGAQRVAHYGAQNVTHLPHQFFKKVPHWGAQKVPHLGAQICTRLSIKNTHVVIVKSALARRSKKIKKKLHITPT